jgi:hypothetical protein
MPFENVHILRHPNENLEEKLEGYLEPNRIV